MVAPRNVNLISATASLAEPLERTHPERVWTQSLSVASLDGSRPPVLADTGSDISLIDQAQVPASAKVDEQTKWTVTWVDEQSLTIPTVKLGVITPWRNKIHCLGVVKRIRHGVEFLLGRDILWGCPTPTPLCCLTASAGESSLTSSDRDTASVTTVPPSAKSSIRPRATLRNPPQTHSRPSPQISQPDGHQKAPPSSCRNITNYRCRACNIRGHFERWSKCPSKLAAAAISTDLRGLAPLIETGITVPNHARDTEGSCSPGSPLSFV